MKDYRHPDPSEPSILLPMEVYQELVAERDRWKARVRELEEDEDFHTRMRLIQEARQSKDEARRAAAVLHENWNYMLRFVDGGTRAQLDSQGMLYDAERLAEEHPWIKAYPTAKKP